MTDMIETGTYRSIPRKISQLTAFVTPEPDMFVLAHLGIPSLARVPVGHGAPFLGWRGLPIGSRTQTAAVVE